MTTHLKNLTREDLASFSPNTRVIRLIEQLIEKANSKIIQTTSEGSTTLINALNNNLVITPNSGFITFAGGGASAQLGGITAALDGQRVVILNDTGSAITIIAESLGSAASNRIYTGGLASCTLNNLGTREFIYSLSKLRWLLIGSVGA